MLKDGNTELFNIDILQYDSHRVELHEIELALQTNAGLDFNSASKLIDAREAKVK